MEIWKRFVYWCQRPSMIKIRRSNPGIEMAQLFRGTKAGAVSGVILGPINLISINIGLNLPYGHLGNWFVGIMTDGMWFLTATIMSIFIGVIFGAIFGLTLAALYDKLPGKTPAIKGIVISLIYWIAIPLCLQLLLYLHEWGFESLYWFFNPYAFTEWGPTVIQLGTSIIWGWLLGRFWESERLVKLDARAYGLSRTSTPD